MNLCATCGWLMEQCICGNNTFPPEEFKQSSVIGVKELIQEGTRFRKEVEKRSKGMFQQGCRECERLRAEVKELEEARQHVDMVAERYVYEYEKLKKESDEMFRKWSKTNKLTTRETATRCAEIVENISSWPRHEPMKRAANAIRKEFNL